VVLESNGYGATTIAGGARMPSENELAIARFQGRTWRLWRR